MLRHKPCAIMPVGLLLGVLTSACDMSMTPVEDVQVPAVAQYVLDRTPDFVAGDDHPLNAVEPGTVIDDLHTLDGCWAAVLTDGELDTSLAFYIVYHFDAQSGRLTRWSFLGQEKTRTLWPLLPIITAEEGPFEVTGDANVQFTVDRILVNTDAAGNLTADLREAPLDPTARVTRPALITLDGQTMLWFIGDESPEEVDESQERPIFRRFDCPE